MPRFRFTKPVLTLLATGSLFSLQAHAADVRVTISPVRSDAGEVLLAVYDSPEQFLKQTRFAAKTPALSRTGSDSVTITLSNVPAGRYALSVFHDRNGNGQLDRNLMGIPQEPLGFSNGATVRMGPPKFADAAFEVGEQNLQLEVKLD